MRTPLGSRALSAGAVDVLCSHDWPGNVRELERVLYQAVLMGSGRSLRAEDVLSALGRSELPRPRQAPLSLEAALQESGGEMPAGDLRAALGVSKSTLGRRVKELVRDGRLVRAGSGSATRYRLVQAPVVEAEDPRWTVALRLAHRDGKVTRRSLAAAIEASERTATRVLSAMVDANLIVDSGGRGRSSGYLPSSRA